MSADIGPGDFVEVTAVGPVPPGGQPSGYRVGALYVVDDVGVWHGQHWLNCVGMRRPVDCGYPACIPGWNAKAFRPIYRPKSSLIESLNAPAPSEREPSLTPA